MNLALEVSGRRPDGYHDICTVLQTVTLADDLTFTDDSQVRLSCTVPELVGPDNLVWKAIWVLRRRFDVRQGVHVRLEKRIPVAAGLGGGSSDAAATLRGLNRLWRLDLSALDLRSIAAELGSDVPFLLTGGAALATGRGDQIQPLARGLEGWLVLLCPPINLPDKTARLYAALTPADYTDGVRCRALANALEAVQAISPEAFSNVFWRAARLVFPDLGTYEAAFREAGAGAVYLSGAGPALYCLAANRRRGEAILSRLQVRGLTAFLVQTPVPADRLSGETPGSHGE